MPPPRTIHKILPSKLTLSPSIKTYNRFSIYTKMNL
jgi:hypothetical protein